MALKAIIMAGGEGVRLQPLTVEMPKPLAPLAGEPVMGYALKLLARHGVSDVGATLWYQPKRIRAAFGKGEGYGVRLRYYEETTPLGTAGSVRMAKEQLRDTFLVLSGDGLTDCDLTAAVRFHREKGALATLVLKRVHVPLPYGVVLRDAEGHITRFIEKPTWSRVFSDLVNTGIYILEPEIFDFIPDSGAPDFGRDLFPALLRAGKALYGYETDGYWCDVGDLRAYLAAQQDLLAGRVDFAISRGAHAEAQVDARASVSGFSWIGRGAVIGPGAVVENSVIGENCVVGPGAVVENACLWSRAAVMAKARAQGCVLCAGAVAKPQAIVATGCALGNGAVAGTGARLLPGVRVWPHLKIAPGATLNHTLTDGDYTAPVWTDRGAAWEAPEDVCALCGAFARQLKNRQALVAGQGNAALEALVDGALAAAGVRVLHAGDMPLPVLQYLTGALRCGGAVYAGEQLTFLDETGGQLSAQKAGAMDACVLRRDMPPAFLTPGRIIRFDGGEEIYLAAVTAQASPRLLWSPVAVLCDHPAVQRLMREGLRRIQAKETRFDAAGARQLREQETGICIDAAGERAGAFCGGCTPAREQITLLLLSLCFKRQGLLFDLPGVPRAAARIAPLRQADESAACLAQQALMRDGVMQALWLCDALKTGRLSDLIAALPETHIVERDFACAPRDKGRILHTLCDSVSLPHTLGDGMRVEHAKGVATIVPDAHRNMVRVSGEAVNAEFAQELCDFYLDRMRRIVGNDEPMKNNAQWG